MKMMDIYISISLSFSFFSFTLTFCLPFSPHPFSSLYLFISFSLSPLYSSPWGHPQSSLVHFAAAAAADDDDDR